jgi:hypothetical protein
MPDQAKERHVRPFAETLQKINRGRLLNELADNMADILEGVMETGKPGSLTLTLKVTKAKAERMIEIVPTIKPNVPRLAPPASMFFVDEASYSLSRTDPLQDELPGISAVPSDSATDKAANE